MRDIWITLVFSIVAIAATLREWWWPHSNYTVELETDSQLKEDEARHRAEIEEFDAALRRVAPAYFQSLDQKRFRQYDEAQQDWTILLYRQYEGAQQRQPRDAEFEAIRQQVINHINDNT